MIVFLWYLETEKGPLRNVASFTAEVCRNKMLCLTLIDIFVTCS